MNDDDEFTPFGGFGSGCDIHGEDYLRECTMCGIEFCSACFPQSALCSDCAAQGALDAEEDEDLPSPEEKELLLLEGFNDDEPEEPAETTPVPAAAPKPAAASARRPAPPKAKPAARKAKPAPRARKAAKPAPGKRPSAQAKPGKPARRPVKAKAKPRKPAKTAPKAKAKARNKR